MKVLSTLITAIFMTIPFLAIVIANSLLTYISNEILILIISIISVILLLIILLTIQKGKTK